MTKICHFSSAHNGLDTRIFHKQCVSLASAGFETHLVMVATSGEVLIAAEKNVKLHSLPQPAGRFSRMGHHAYRCFLTARRLNADIYHFHDPELIPYGILLSLNGKKVIYDVHEDVPRDILSKEWIPSWLRKAASVVVATLESIAARYFLFICAATPFIVARFKKITAHAVNVNNFPLPHEFAHQAAWADKRVEVCYVGGIDNIRGIREVCAAMGQVKSSVRLSLAGRFSDPVLEQAVQAMSGWSRVNALGYLDRVGVRDVLDRSVAGLVTLHPVINYLDALPVKMFEYMAAGIPVIASDFPLWREIIVGNKCGLCVDPMDPAAIARAIDHLVQHPNEARQMGENGRRAVLEKYNWAVEQQKLLQLYEDLLKA